MVDDRSIARFRSFVSGLDVIDDSVRTFQHFPYLREFNFRDDAARLGESANLLGASSEAVNDSQCLFW